MIVNHNVKKNQFVGVQRAYFEISGTGDQSVVVPLSGPKQIRKVSVVTGNNAGSAVLDLNVLQSVGGDPIVTGLAVNTADNTSVVASESMLNENFVKMDDSFDGLCFEVNNNLAGDNWSLRIEVIYSARTNINNNVYVDEKVEGLL